MSARSLPNSARALVMALLALGSASCLALDKADFERVYGTFRSNEDVQGLYEIGTAAREWIAKENARQGTDWEAFGPNLKVFVPRCAVPLKVQWADRTRHFHRGLSVICGKLVNSAYGKPWDVFVPADRKSEGAKKSI